MSTRSTKHSLGSATMVEFDDASTGDSTGLFSSASMVGGVFGSLRFELGRSGSEREYKI